MKASSLWLAIESLVEEGVFKDLQSGINTYLEQKDRSADNIRVAPGKYGENMYMKTVKVEHVIGKRVVKYKAEMLLIPPFELEEDGDKE